MVENVQHTLDLVTAGLSVLQMAGELVLWAGLHVAVIRVDVASIPLQVYTDLELK
jgi:hypothetical protein